MNRRWTCFALLGLLFLPATLRAEDAAPPKPPAQTLDIALLHAKPSENIGLAVEAASVKLPQDAVLPGDPMTAQEAGALYGEKTQPFGTVTAIAPPTITVVYAPPETPNPYDGMPPGQGMKLLSQTFTPAQWKAFMSPAGVGYVDMAGDTQTSLFQALFPGGHLEIIEDNPVGDNDPNSKRDFSGDALSYARLRLGSMTMLALQSAEDPNSHTFGAGFGPANSPPRFFMTNAQTRELDKEYGAQVSETLPNTPKVGQIAFDNPNLKAPVSLAGIKTVDDLVVRISRAVKREIYADPRYAARMVTLSPSAGPQSAPAADLLQAVALCVGGTYRRVGPAFVLTNDTIGLGTKHADWKAFEDKAQSMMPNYDPMPAETPNPDVPYTIKDIPDGNDPLAFTKAQKEKYWQEWAKNPGHESNLSMDITVPFSQLSPAQQEAAGMMQEDNEKRHFGTLLGGTVMVQESPEVEVLLPSVSGPIEIFESYEGLLPYPPLTPAEEVAQRKHFEMMDPELAAQDTPAPDFLQTLHRFPRRAAHIAPKTAKEAAQNLAALQALGFNEAWIDIQPSPAATDADTAARLTQAVAEGKKLGIRVLPDISLLRWSDGADPGVLDCDIQGKTILPPQDNAFSPAVSPFAPAAAQRLAALVRALGGVPGIGGMVWENTLSTGYEKADKTIGRFGNTLGYSEAGRLTFLRLAHADPVDLVDNSYSDERAKVQLLGFGDGSDLERRLFADWGRTRSDAEQNLLHFLTAALPASFTGIDLPLLLPPSNAWFGSTVGSWDNLHAPPPTVRFIAQIGPDGQPLMGVPSIERMGSALAYKKIQVYLPPSPSAQAFKDAAARSLAAAAKQGAANVVVDLTGQAGLLQEAPRPNSVGTGQQKLILLPPRIGN